VAERGEVGAEASGVLREILATEISPELIPRADGADGPAPDTEAVIGPYELQDFNLYYILRFGYAPAKVAFLAYCAWRDGRAGTWPDLPLDQRRQYDIGRIKEVLGIFLDRFFRLSQYKRSCIPNGPKVGSVSLSPRGDWRMPSDATGRAWLAVLDEDAEAR